MSPSESDSEMGSSGCGSDEEATASSGTENVDTQTYEKMSSKTWKKQLFDKLGEIDTFGDFACMNRYSHHINPGLEVVGSPIPLPLVSRDASTIKSNCEQAPFGRGEDTLVDESVRKTWQLDHGLYRCSNPSWPAFLEDTVLRDIVQKLGMYVLIIEIISVPTRPDVPRPLTLSQASAHPSGASQTVTVRRGLVLQAPQGL
jgi:hypothetical protein